MTVIVAVRNERDRIRTCLEALINQNYPTELLEIIIVNDQSTDGTSLVLAEYQNRYSALTVIRNDSTPLGLSSKKFALSKAIAKSKGEILLFTDADCVPLSNWVRSMVACFEPDIGLVCGFSPLVDPDDSVLGALVLLDSLAAGIIAAGSIGSGTAVTCTARNLAYRREVYDQLNGLTRIMHRISGDDDLLLQMVYSETNWKITFAITKESIVPCYQTKSLTGFFTQKRRHLSAGKYYNFKLQVAYFLFHAANAMLYLFFIVSLVSGKNLFIAAFLLLNKFLIDGILLFHASQIFQIRMRMKYFPLWELFFLVYNLIIGPSSWIGKIKWQ